MDYEQKYKEALERARQFFEKPYLEDSAGIVGYIFPELAESEEEKNIKNLIDELKCSLKVTKWQNESNGGEEKRIALLEWAIAWLEKQGDNMGISEAAKQKLEDNLNKALEKETPESWNEFLYKQGEQKPNYCHHEVDLSECSEEYRKAYYDGWNNCNQQHAQLKAEQKPAWSEEDEAIYYGVIETEQYMLDVVNGIKEFDVGNISIKEDCTRELDWLKSLRPQSTWKPSDEQMNTLWDAIVFVEGCNSNFKGSGSVLENLYNNLKKLREE